MLISSELRGDRLLHAGCCVLMYPKCLYIFLDGDRQEGNPWEGWEDAQEAQRSLAWHSYQHGARLMRGKLQEARALGACCPGLRGSEVVCRHGMGTEEAASSAARS